MYGYIKGTIKIVNPNHVILENNDIGYAIYVANPYFFQIDKDYTIYIYNYLREDENTLYGFKSLEEKELFLKLINVKGLGPKTAMPMFASGSVHGITDAIERENLLYLKKFPKIGDKLARQIVLDLKGKLVNSVKGTDVNEELIEVLTGLGYKLNDIKKIIPKINQELNIESQIKEALRFMLN